MADRSAALIVSGYLGSGKTSLVRHLLARSRDVGLRVGVVSNELGELGVDAALLARRDEDYVELAGGCVCCRLSGELIETLEGLRQRVRPDRIVVETSGVALPFETQLHLWRPPLCDWIEDDVSVVVVNAEQLAAGRDLDATFEQQVSSADLLVLNQIDRVDPDRLPALACRLRELEPDAPILRATHGRVDPDLLFPPDAAGARRGRADPAAASAHDGHEHECFATEVLEVRSGVAESELLARIRALGALRAKGFVRTRDGLRLLQGVGPRIELAEVQAPPHAELIGRVVAIRRA
jgi:cobalamin biosynthesis protein CobW